MKEFLFMETSPDTDQAKKDHVKLTGRKTCISLKRTAGLKSLVNSVSQNQIISFNYQQPILFTQGEQNLDELN